MKTFTAVLDYRSDGKWFAMCEQTGACVFAYSADGAKELLIGSNRVFNRSNVKWAFHDYRAEQAFVEWGQ